MIYISNIYIGNIYLIHKYLILYITYLILYVKYSILYHIYSILTHFNHISTHFKNPPLSFRLLFLRDVGLLEEHVFFLRFRPNPYTIMCLSTIGSYFTFSKKHEICGKSQIESWVGGFSLIFDFSVYLESSSRITFPPRVGDHVPGP